MKERFLKLLEEYKMNLSCVTFDESERLLDVIIDGFPFITVCESERLLDVIIDGFPFITVCESDFDGGDATALAYAVARAVRLSEHYTRG